MQDRPTKLELLRGVEDVLRNDALTGLTGPAKFRARVAANVVAMILRELETEEDAMRAEHASLATLLDQPAAAPDAFAALAEAVDAMNATLSDRINGGDADAGAFRTRVLDHLRAVTVRKLAVTDPKLSAAVASEYAGGS